MTGSVDGFFAGFPDSFNIFNRLSPKIESLDGVTRAAQKSQISFRRKKLFAAVWVPEKELGQKMAPLVLSLFTRSRLRSERFKQVVEPAPGRFTHHVELWSVQDVDDDVQSLLRSAWEDAGPAPK